MVTPNTPRSKDTRVSYAPSAGEAIALDAAAGIAGESVGTWLRFVAVRLAKGREKVARPKSQDEHRGDPTSIRVTTEQREAIEAAAKANGMNLSEFVIACGLAEAKRLGVK